jgi:hypothetical protein
MCKLDPKGKLSAFKDSLEDDERGEISRFVWIGAMVALMAAVGAIITIAVTNHTNSIANTINGSPS